jgi:Protein of unknown function (DUF4038)/Putative collagen-binding domain of a collagenase
VGYITGLGGVPGPGYFTDAAGTPVLMLADEVWALIANAGRWNGGDWQADMAGYLNLRAGQGFNAIYTEPFGSVHIGAPDDSGSTWDGVPPFITGTDPSSGLNGPFWSRVDYLLAEAAAHDMTVFLNVSGGAWDSDAGAIWAGKNATQYTNYGAAMAARYAAVQNLVWVFEDDYYSTFDSLLTALLNGLRDNGDTHAVSIENISECTSRWNFTDGTPIAWGAAHADWNFVYSYTPPYVGVEAAYAETNPIPVVWGDGYFIAGGSTYSATLDRAARQEAWWALASGARGWNIGDEGEWKWDAGSAAQVAGGWFANHNAGNIRRAVEGLSGWHKLIPDSASALVTGNRGTRAGLLPAGSSSGSKYEPAFTNTYVGASRTPDGSLALLYLPTAKTITIDETQMAEGYGAKWIDPVTGAATDATPGATYNSAAKGANSAGDPDWVLALSSPPYATWTVPA